MKSDIRIIWTREICHYNLLQKVLRLHASIISGLPLPSTEILAAALNNTGNVTMSMTAITDSATALPPDVTLPQPQLAKEYKAKKTEWFFSPNPSQKTLFPLYLTFEDQPEGRWVYFEENEIKEVPIQRKKSLRNIYIWNNGEKTLQPVTPEMLPPKTEEEEVPESPANAYLPPYLAKLAEQYNATPTDYWFCNNPSRSYPIFFGPRAAWIIFREEGIAFVNQKKGVQNIYTWNPTEGFQPTTPASAPGETIPSGVSAVQELQQLFGNLLGEANVNVEQEIALSVGLTKKTMKDIQNVDVIATVKEERQIRDMLEILKVPTEEKRANLKSFYEGVMEKLKGYERSNKRKSCLSKALPGAQKLLESLNILSEPKVHMLHWRAVKYGLDVIVEAHLQSVNDNETFAIATIAKNLLFESLKISDAKNNQKEKTPEGITVFLHAGFRIKKVGELNQGENYWFDDGVFLKAVHPNVVGPDFVYIKKERLAEIFLLDGFPDDAVVLFDIEREPQDNDDRKIEFVYGKRRLSVNLYQLVNQKEIFLFKSVLGDAAVEDLLGKPIYAIRTKDINGEPTTAFDNMNNSTIIDGTAVSLLMKLNEKDKEKTVESLCLSEFFYFYPFSALEGASNDLREKLGNSFFM
eukprot:gene5513-3975_t